MTVERGNDAEPASAGRLAAQGTPVALRRVEWGTLRISGPDRATWLNGIVTCDVAAVTQDEGAWGLLLSKQGKIEAELQIVGSGDALFVAVSAERAAEVAASLDRYLVMEDAEVEVLPGCAWWELHGAGAATTAREARAAVGQAVLGAGAMSWTVRGGAALVGTAEAAATIEAALERADAQILEPAEWEAERVRLGLPRYGVDYGGQDNPHAAGLERRTVSWSKGCYLGQEVVCMQDMRGKVKRTLVRLELDDPEAADVQADTEVIGGPSGEACGRVTSRAGGFALASLKTPANEPGTRVSVGGAMATVRALEVSEGQ